MKEGKEDVEAAYLHSHRVGIYGWGREQVGRTQRKPYRGKKAVYLEKQKTKIIKNYEKRLTRDTLCHSGEGKKQTNGVSREKEDKK